MTDTGYTMVLMKDGMAFCDDNTTAITVSNPPILESNRCQHTGMWRLNLDPENPKTIKPRDDQCHLWSLKLMQNFSLVPRISRIIPERNIHWCCPQQKLCNMAKTKGDAHQPILPRLGQDSERRTLKRPTPRHLNNKTKSIGENYRNKTVRIKIEGEISPFHHIPITKTHEAFFHIENLSNSIHTDQTGAFPFTSQWGNRYIMVFKSPWRKLHFCQTYA
jgi:hypothetical protein